MSKPIIESYEVGKAVSHPDGSRAVLVGGCFDILHFGHLQFLEKAKASGDYLIVALEPDQSINKYKKRAPVHNQQERALNLASLRSVDKVLLLPALKGFDDYSQLTHDVRPQIIAITAGDPQTKNKQAQADAINARLDIVNTRIEELSSSKIYKLRKLDQEGSEEQGGGR